MLHANLAILLGFVCTLLVVTTTALPQPHSMEEAMVAKDSDIRYVYQRLQIIRVKKMDLLKHKHHM